MKKQFPIIKTKRLLLRQFNQQDLENVYKGLSHHDVIKYYGVSYESLEATRAQMDFFTTLEKEGTGFWWAICSSDNKIFYGAGGLNNFNKNDKKAEIGFWLMPDFWAKGIMKETIPLICNYGFQEWGLHRIEAVIESENTASKKTVAASGFEYEGTMKECEFKNGNFISLDFYAKIASRI
jgi:ribosomal-protein-alanine N-acetyltransferase